MANRKDKSKQEQEKMEQKEKKKKNVIDQTSEDSFPASDAPSWAGGKEEYRGAV